MVCSTRDLAPIRPGWCLVLHRRPCACLALFREIIGFLVKDFKSKAWVQYSCNELVNFCHRSHALKPLFRRSLISSQKPLRRILGKLIWSSCVRFTFAHLLMNTILAPILLIHTCLVPESWIFQFTHDICLKPDPHLMFCVLEYVSTPDLIKKQPFQMVHSQLVFYVGFFHFFMWDWLCWSATFSYQLHLNLPIYRNLLSYQWRIGESWWTVTPQKRS